MAETTKRSTTNSASKSRKSRTDIVRTTLGMYLNEKNYTQCQDKFRKSDLALTQSMEQYDMNVMMDNDLAKQNTISYSNVLCLSNHHTTVDMQFSKFVKFVQSQNVPAIRTELQSVLWPLLCHIYIEMVKGKDTEPAAEFLRRYAHLIGPIENLNSPVVNTVNGTFAGAVANVDDHMISERDPTVDSDPEHDAESEFDTDFNFGGTDITFDPEPEAELSTRPDGYDADMNLDTDLNPDAGTDAVADDKNDSVDEESTQSPIPPTPSGSKQIIYSTDAKSPASPSTVDGTKHAPFTDFMIATETSDYFKELIESLSLCMRIEEIESVEIVRRFRNAKFEMVLSLQTLYAIKHFLVKNGHVIILHILQTWFSFEIREAIADSETDEDDVDEAESDSDQMDTMDAADAAAMTERNGLSDDEHRDDSNSSGNNMEADEQSPPLTDTHSEIRKMLNKCSLEVKIVNGLSSNNSFHESIYAFTNVADTDSNSSSPTDKSLPDATTTTTSSSSYEQHQPNHNAVLNKYLQNVRAAVQRTRKFEPPIRVYNLLNVDHKLSAGDFDTMDCHVACAFDDSTIKLWQLNQSRIRGRKPFSALANRLCEWSMENCESSSDEDEDSDGDGSSEMRRDMIGGSSFSNYQSLNSIKRGTNRNRKEKKEQKRIFMEQRCEANTFSETEGLTLRGHNKGVTDILFSKYNPLMYSVSKDTTMRAWKASDYQCGAIYRGHNYPIWCVSESSTGLYLATGSRDLTARLWSTEREHLLQTYIGHTQDVDAIAFHPNGNYIATGSTDLTVRLWDVTSGRLLRVFIDCHLPVNCVSFSPDGKFLAAAGEESKIRIFDLAAGSQLTELKDHTSTVNSIAWNASGSKVASCSADGSLRVYTINKIGQSTLQNPANATPSTASGSSNNISNSSKLLTFSDTGCKRTVKVFFGQNDIISCIGNA